VAPHSASRSATIAATWPPRCADYHARTLVIAQIETERGLDDVEAIAGGGGRRRAVGQGTSTCPTSWACPRSSTPPASSAAMQRVAEVARRHGKAAGFMATGAAWIDRVKAMRLHA
jgi:2-keto-3-deoxy-L-rhamnonate aldolase RhmA